MLSEFVGILGKAEVGSSILPGGTISGDPRRSDPARRRDDPRRVRINPVRRYLVVLSTVLQVDSVKTPHPHDRIKSVTNG